MTRNSAILLAIFAALLAISLTFPEKFYSPGPLAPAHGQIVNCSTCHQGFTKPRGETCVAAACHDRPSWERRKGVFMAHLETSGCLNCHTEHPGPEKEITFVASHEKAAGKTCEECHMVTAAHFPVDRPDCSKCHIAIGWKPARFTHAALRPEEGCKKCHKTPEKHAYTELECATCHEFMSWKPARMDHGKIGMDKTCSQCHKLPVVHGATDFECSRCHETAKWKPARFDHRVLGAGESCGKCHKLPLVHGATDFECSRCHETAKWKPARFDHGAIKTGQSCVKCHKQPERHVAVPEGKECDRCHGVKAWKPARFDHTVLPAGDPCYKCHRLPEKHFLTRVKCGFCHQTNSWKGARMDHSTLDPQAACASCHPLPTRHMASAKDCRFCHGVENWRTLTLDHRFPFHHGSRGGANQCQVCHPQTLERYNCVSACHEHGEMAMRVKHIKEGITDISACAKCHPTGREHEGEGREGRGEGGWERDGERGGKHDDDD